MIGAQSPQHTSCSLLGVPSGLNLSVSFRIAFVLCACPFIPMTTVLSLIQESHAAPVTQVPEVVGISDLCSEIPYLRDFFGESP